MIDRDLAKLYQVETRVLNQAVKRNIERFPDDFKFQLNSDEFKVWKSQIVISNDDKMGLRKAPFVFTEQGVAMLSSVLKSKVAVKVSISIMKAFVEMRKLVSGNSGFVQRIEKIERKQYDSEIKFEKIFKALESHNLERDQGIFFDGQIFDSYFFVCRLIRSAKQTIIVIDNYLDESVLTHLTKKKKGVRVLILTKKITSQMNLDIQKANEQYADFKVITFTKSHDRFLIIDEHTIFHLGASLKDLGKKWFAFSRLNKSSVDSIMKAIKLWI